MQIEVLFNGTPAQFGIAVYQAELSRRIAHEQPLFSTDLPSPNAVQVHVRLWSVSPVRKWCGDVHAQSAPNDTSLLIIRSPDDSWTDAAPAWEALRSELDRQGWFPKEELQNRPHKPSLLDQILLEQEQKDLLVTVVEASRNVPRERREKFLVLETNEDTTVIHPGLPGQTAKVYSGDIDVLAQAGLINYNRLFDKLPQFDVSPLGYKYYGDLKQQTDHPVRQVELAITEYLRSERFQQVAAIAYRKWLEAERLLWVSDAQQQLTTIGHLCREAMQEFATALVERYQPPKVNTNKASDVARIRAVLDQQATVLGTTLKPFLDALLAYWGTVSDLVQRQVHGAQREGLPLVWEDARRVVFQTSVVMSEIDRAIILNCTRISEPSSNPPA